jgi:hypothetical protein
MVKHRLPVLLLLAAHGAAAAAPTASPAWIAKAAQTLMGQEDANSLATAAALSAAAKLEPAAQELALRASELAPQNAAIGWLRLELCARVQTCDIRDIATVLRWIDPDNAAAWLPTLIAAQRDRDTTEVDRVLTDMARAHRFDLYWNRIVVLMFDALEAVRNELPAGGAASDSARYKAVIGIVGGEIIPPFGQLADACRESAGRSERRDPCLKLSKTMQRGDTITVQLMGFSIERRLVAPDSKEARAIAERRHVLEWRVTSAARFDSALLPWTRNARARARLAQMRALPREEDVCIAILRAHKIALEPP